MVFEVVIGRNRCDCYHRLLQTWLWFQPFLCEIQCFLVFLNNKINIMSKLENNNKINKNLYIYIYIYANNNNHFNINILTQLIARFYPRACFLWNLYHSNQYYPICIYFYVIIRFINDEWIIIKLADRNYIYCYEIF